MTAGSVRNYWTSLKTFFKYAKKMGWSNLSLNKTIIPYSIKSEREIRIYTDQELNLILDGFFNASTYPKVAVAAAFWD